MSMDLDTLREHIASNHGNITGKDAILLVLLNLIIEDLADNYNWQDLFMLDPSITLGTSDYMTAIPASMQYLDVVNLLDSSGNWYEVDVRTLDTFRGLDNNGGMPIPSETGTPTDCAFRGRTLYFNKKVDKTYTAYLEGWRYPVPMTTGTDVPDISSIDWLLIAYGTGALYMHRKQPQAADPWMKMADYFFKQKTSANKPGRPTGKSSKRPKMGI